MKITQNTKEDSLDFTFKKKTAPSLRIKPDDAGNAVIEINGTILDPSITGASPITFYASSTHYNKKQLVVKDGELYRSLIDDNIGHDPVTDKVNWVRLEHIIEYSNTLPKATENSVTFVEINEQLYYKTVVKDEYVYKAISSGEHSGGIADVQVDGESVVTDDVARISLPIKTWSAAHVYMRHDLVTFGGHVFESQEDNNKGRSPIETREWRDFDKVLVHVETIPEATADSPYFLEYTGNLYYKVESTKSKFIEYEYKVIPTISAGLYLELWNEAKVYAIQDYVFKDGKIYLSLTDNNKGNFPPDKTDSEYWHIVTTSIVKVAAEEASSPEYEFDSHVLYEIWDQQTYTNAQLLSFSGEAEKAGWTITRDGVINNNIGVYWLYSIIPSHWTEVQNLLEPDINGDLAVAYNKHGNLVCRYKEPFVDVYTYSINIYDNVKGLIKLTDSESVSYQPYVVTTDKHITPHENEPHVLIPELTTAEVSNLAQAYLSGRPAYITDSKHTFRAAVIFANQEFAGQTRSAEFISILYTENTLINYINIDNFVSYKIVELDPKVVEVSAVSGYLPIDTLTDKTIIKYHSPATNDYLFMTLEADTPASLIYSCTQYKITINKTNSTYTITENSSTESPVFEVEASYIGLPSGTGESKFYRYPDLSYNLISQIFYLLKSKEVVIRVGDEIYKIYSFQEGQYGEYILTLSCYNEHIDDIMFIIYTSSQLNTAVELRPMHDVVFTRYESSDGQQTGTLPDKYIDLYKHGNTPTNFVVRFFQGSEYAPKISNLKYEYREDNRYYYENKEFACEITWDSCYYIIVKK